MGWVTNSDQPGSSSMVQKLLNLSADRPGAAKGAPSSCAGAWKASGARGCSAVTGAGTSQAQEKRACETSTSQGKAMTKPSRIASTNGGHCLTVRTGLPWNCECAIA